MGRNLVPQVDEHGEVIVPPTPVMVMAESITKDYTIIQFRNKAMISVSEPYPHFKPLTKEYFDRIFYYSQPGQTRSRVGDVYAQVCFGAPDYTEFDHKILFGRYDIIGDAEKPANAEASIGASVWDTRTLEMESSGFTECVWRSPYAKVGMGRDEHGTRNRIPFIMDLACGDPDVYDDIMQSIAPMIMEKKPDGVIWWIGDGANGKSTLMDALYRLFPNQLSSLTVKALMDGRDTPSLNGHLANIVKESSEGRIDDTETYKSIGTHEDFTTHTFHKQEPTTINGNMHHIFSGNRVPVFNDKGYSARRRTNIIPFAATFESDPTFEDRTFTPEFFGQLAHEMCVYANMIKRAGYKYNFSAKTRAAKGDYDTQANNAEEYVRDLLRTGVVAFDNVGAVRTDYENWCRDNGYVELGKDYLRRAVFAVGFEKVSARFGDKVGKIHKLPDIASAELTPVGGFRMGLYTYTGFTPLDDDEEPATPTVPDFDDAKPVDEVEKKGSEW